MNTQLRDALNTLPEATVTGLVLWAETAVQRDPKESPAYLDKLMASGGPGRARYRDVAYVEGNEVVFRESTAPFDPAGKVGRLTLAAWKKWAAKASVQHKASLQTSIPGLNGYWLEWEILDAWEVCKQQRQIADSWA